MRGSSCQCHSCLTFFVHSQSSSSSASNTGAIGIGVGAGAAVLLAVVAMAVYYRGRDARKRKAADERVTVSFENPTVGRPCYRQYCKSYVPSGCFSILASTEKRSRTLCIKVLWAGHSVSPWVLTPSMPQASMTMILRGFIASQP